SDTKVIDAKGHRVIPGLHDSHTHGIREGLHYAMELRWDWVDSVEEALAMLAEEVKHTPKGISTTEQWRKTRPERLLRQYCYPLPKDGKGPLG
ncbi:MAG: amidohydrolase family protein, partial [Bacteroidota bacterium]